MTIAKPFLSVAEVASEIGVRPDLVLSWVASRHLVAADVSRGRGVRPRWRIDRRDLDAFLAARKTASVATVSRRGGRPIKSFV